MPNDNDDAYDEGDDFDPDFLPGGDDIDLEFDEQRATSDASTWTARQKIEARREMAWLRDETADWDYWNDYLQPQ